MFGVEIFLLFIRYIKQTLSKGSCIFSVVNIVIQTTDYTHLQVGLAVIQIIMDLDFPDMLMLVWVVIFFFCENLCNQVLAVMNIQ